MFFRSAKVKEIQSNDAYSSAKHFIFDERTTLAALASEHI
jgi:hypothetical protein